MGIYFWSANTGVREEYLKYLVPELCVRRVTGSPDKESADEN